MKSRNITAVVVGADRVAMNGDTANKIGTYQVIHTRNTRFNRYLYNVYRYFNYFLYFTDCHSR